MREGVEFAAFGLFPLFDIQLSLYITVVGKFESAAGVLGCQIFIRLAGGHHELLQCHGHAVFGGFAVVDAFEAWEAGAFDFFVDAFGAGVVIVDGVDIFPAITEAFDVAHLCDVGGAEFEAEAVHKHAGIILQIYDCNGARVSFPA